MVTDEAIAFLLARLRLHICTSQIKFDDFQNTSSTLESSSMFLSNNFSLYERLLVSISRTRHPKCLKPVCCIIVDWLCDTRVEMREE